MKKIMFGLTVLISLLLCTLVIGCGGNSSPEGGSETTEVKRVDTIEKVNVNNNYMSDVEPFYDTDNDYYMYSMGTIANVPLEKPVFFYYGGKGEIEQSFTKSSTTVSSISTTVQSVVQSRLHWELSKDKGASIEVGIGELAKATVSYKISGKKGAEFTTTETNSYTEFTEWTNSQQKSITIKFDERYQAGYYAYLVSATIKVRVILVKNRSTGTVCVGSYNELLAFGYSFVYNEFDDKLTVDNNQNFKFELPDLESLSVPTAFIDVNNEYTKITNVQEFNEINEHLDGKYIIANDLNFNGAQITPIGGANGSFTGVIMGCGHTIENFSISASFSNVGLIARNTGVIEYIMVKHATISADVTAGDVFVGAVVGVNSGRVAGCWVSNSSIEARAIDRDNTENSSRYTIVGGVVGKISDGVIKNCSTERVSLYGYVKKHDKAWSDGWNEAAFAYIGGIVGEQVGGIVINNTTNSLTKIEGSAEYRGNGLVKIYTRSRICIGGVIGRQSNAGFAQSGNVCNVNQSEFKHSFDSYNRTSGVNPIEEYRSGSIVGYVG